MMTKVEKEEKFKLGGSVQTNEWQWKCADEWEFCNSQPVVWLTVNQVQIVQSYKN